MYRKSVSLSQFALLALVALMIVAGSAFAQEEENPNIPFIDDGRINAYDIDARAVVYYSTDSRPLYNDDGSRAFNSDGSEAFEDFISAIQVYTVNDEGGQLALSVAIHDLHEALEDDARAVFSENGVVLEADDNGNLVVMATTALNGQMPA